MVRQHLLVDVEEAVAAGLAQDGVADRLVLAERAVDRVIGGGFDADHAGFLGRATACDDIDVAGCGVHLGLDDKSVGRVGLKPVRIDRAGVQRVSVDEGEARFALNQRVETYAEFGARGDVGRAVDLEAAVLAGRVVRGVQGDDQLAVRADVQAGDVDLAALASVEGALGDVDVQQAVAVGQLAGDGGAARDRQAICTVAEGDVADDSAVADVHEVRARTQAHVSADHRLLGVGNAVIVHVRQGVVRHHDGVLGEGDARSVFAEVDGDRFTGDIDAGCRGDAYGDDAGVAEVGQGAGLVTNADSVGFRSAYASGDLAGVFERRQRCAGGDVDARHSVLAA
ncbi:hypothetical protein D3C85_807860 [compost metagenome]